MTLTPPGRWQTNSAVPSDLAQMVRYGLPDTDWDGFAGRMRSLSPSDTEARPPATSSPGPWSGSWSVAVP